MPDTRQANPQLHQLIQQNVAAWRENGYPADAYPAIAEILRRGASSY